MPPGVGMHTIHIVTHHLPGGHILEQWGVYAMPLGGDNIGFNRCIHLAIVQLQLSRYILLLLRCNMQAMPAGGIHNHKGRGWAVCQQGQGVQVCTGVLLGGHNDGHKRGGLEVLTVPLGVLLHPIPPVPSTLLGFRGMVTRGRIKLLPGVPRRVLLQGWEEDTMPPLGLLPRKLGRPNTVPNRVLRTAHGIITRTVWLP